MDTESGYDFYTYYNHIKSGSVRQRSDEKDCYHPCRTEKEDTAKAEERKENQSEKQQKVSGNSQGSGEKGNPDNWKESWKGGYHSKGNHKKEESEHHSVQSHGQREESL